MKMIQLITQKHNSPNTGPNMRTRKMCKSMITALFLFVSAFAFADELTKGMEAYEKGEAKDKMKKVEKKSLKGSMK